MAVRGEGATVDGERRMALIETKRLLVGLTVVTIVVNLSAVALSLYLLNLSNAAVTYYEANPFSTINSASQFPFLLILNPLAVSLVMFVANRFCKMHPKYQRVFIAIVLVFVAGAFLDFFNNFWLVITIR
jgi:hypothetical protein